MVYHAIYDPSRGDPSGEGHRPGERPPAVLFDNHSPKGHHYHIQGVEGPYVFVDLDRLLADFKAAIVQVRRGRQE